MLKNLKNRIFNRLQVIFQTNITKSRVSNIKLIHTDSKIINSILTGNIRTSRGTIIEDAMLIGDIEIGKYSTFNGPNSAIYSLLNPVIIGSFCSIASNVTIQEYNHRKNRTTTYFILKHIFKESWVKETESIGPIEIGNDVWIGAHSVILSGVKIAHGSVIGANSVVTKDIPPYAIAVGSPCKVVSYRFNPEIIENLLKIEWWNWNIEKIKKNKKIFEEELTIDKFKEIVE